MTTLRTVRELGTAKIVIGKGLWVIDSGIAGFVTELASRFCKPVQSSHWKSQTIRSRPLPRWRSVECARKPCNIIVTQDHRVFIHPSRLTLRSSTAARHQQCARERVALQYEQYMSDKTTSYRITSRWMLFFAPLKSTFAGTSCYQNTFPQASYEHIQALTILGHSPFSVERSVSSQLMRTQGERTVFWTARDETLLRRDAV